MIKQMGRALSRSRSRQKPRRGSESAPGSMSLSQLSNDSDDEISIDDYLSHNDLLDISSSHNMDYMKPKRQLPSDHVKSRPLSPPLSSNSSSYYEPSPVSSRGRDRDEKREKHRHRSRSTGHSSKNKSTNGSTGSHKDEERRRKSHSTRSKSASRRSPELERQRDNEGQSSRKSSTYRSKSQERRGQAFSSNVSKSHDSSELQSKRKSKMEKIMQLQEKNQRYKEEFRKVQKDRKSLKKDLEGRKEEISCLTRDIDTYVAEINALKLKLSDTLAQLDWKNADENEKEELFAVQEELQQAKERHSNTACELDELKQKIVEIEKTVYFKEALVKDLQYEVNLNREIVEGLQDENKKLKGKCEELSSSEKRLNELSDQNETLKSDLLATVQHASDMVKEREDAIADLLRENDEMKRIMSTKDDVISSYEFVQLKQEIAVASASLEEAQDRNIAFEEEIETLVQKNEELEAEQIRLRDDLDAWQEKASGAQQTVSLLERNSEADRRRASEAEEKLIELEQKYSEEQAEADRQNKIALAAIEKAAYEKAMMIAEAKSRAPPNPQEVMLQAAVANQQRKQAEAAKSSWGGVIAGFRRGNGSEADENLTNEEQRIRELEAINGDQEEEIKKLKSELVRLRSTHNDALYTNKKKVEKLQNENRSISLKVQALEVELEHIRRSDANFPDLVLSSSNSD